MNYSFYQFTVIRVSSICMDSHRNHYLLDFLRRPKGPCPELSAQRQISHLIMHHVLAAMLGKWQTKPICTEHTISSVQQTFNLHSRSNKKNQFKTRRQFHYLHNGKLLFFKLVFFFTCKQWRKVESDNKTEERCQSTHSGIAIMRMCYTMT